MKTFSSETEKKIIMTIIMSERYCATVTCTVLGDK